MTTPAYIGNLPFPDPKIERWLMSHENEKYTQDRKADAEDQAHPGTPLEPDELPESPGQFPYAGKRQEPDVHPTSELSSTPSHKPGPIRPSGKHPTAELHIKPKGRR